jgi:hypothetical protein
MPRTTPPGPNLGPTKPRPPTQITDSSEALLSGRKPPLRLLVRAKHRDGRALAVRPAVSEGFVVTTRRTRNDVKADIPSVDDPISKIKHMGKETVKKLQDLRNAATQARVRRRSRGARRGRGRGGGGGGACSPTVAAARRPRAQKAVPRGALRAPSGLPRTD